MAKEWVWYDDRALAFDPSDEPAQTDFLSVDYYKDRHYRDRR